MSNVFSLFSQLARGYLARPASWQPRAAMGVGLVLLTGCGYHQAYPDVRYHRVFFNDFEHMAGWLPEASPTLTTERAHSGRYAVKVDAAHEFSLTYRLKLGDAFTIRPRRMRLSAWAWVESSAEDAQLVFNLSAPDDPQNKSKLYAQIFLVDHWPYKRWTHVTRDIDLPPEVSSKAELSVYLWRNSATHPVYTDDWELTELH